MLFSDVVDQLLNQHGFANSSTAEEANFSSLAVRSQEINHLDARFEHFGLGL